MHNLIQHHRENLYGLSTALHFRFITNHEYQESLEEQQCWLSMLDAIENAQASLAYGKNEAIRIILEAESI